MALNWFLTLRNLSKSDETALALFTNLQKATTDEEKSNAKQQAQEYIQKIQSAESAEKPTETDSVPESEESTVVPDSENTTDDSELQVQADIESDETVEEPKEEVKSNMLDLSAPAFNPRLAKCGINREEELFLQGVYVRKLSHEEKVLLRRSIYQKKTQRNAKIQAEYKAKRIEQKQQELNDPEKIKFHQERKLVYALTSALEQHKNMIWIFDNIEGLTPDILKELLQKPGIANAVRQANPNFIENFNKKYGV